MDDKIKELIDKLREKGETISFMESCTGGYCANSITNISGSSDVLRFSAVTYSNEYKIKLGVDENIINKYTVYSTETSIEMAKNIKEFSKSEIGVGITGQIGNIDPRNNGELNKVFYTICYKDKLYSKTLNVNGNRKESKEYIFNKILCDLLEIIE